MKGRKVVSLVLSLMMLASVFVVSPLAVSASQNDGSFDKRAFIENMFSSATAMTVEWQKCDNVTGYQVAFRQAGNYSYKYFKTDRTKYVFRNLKPGTKYWAVVRPYKIVNGKKDYGYWSEKFCCFTRPGETKITSMTSTKNSIKVKWKKAPGASEYIVAFRRAGSYDYKYYNVKGTSKVFKNLKSNVKYKVYVTPVKYMSDSWDAGYLPGKQTPVKTCLTKKVVKKSNAPTKSSASGGDSSVVYITETGSRYHFDPDCKGIGSNETLIGVTLGKAKSKGYSLCRWE